MYKKLIGEKSKKVLNNIELGAVKKFANSIGVEHPIFTEVNYGKKSIFERNIVPVTFPMTLDFGVIESLELPKQGLIHGEQTFHYERPLFVGETIYCYSNVENYIEKEGKSGSMGFLKIKNIGEDVKSNKIFTSTTTLIINESVRKGMET